MPRLQHLLICALAAGTLLPNALRAQSDDPVPLSEDSSPHSDARLVAPVTAIQPGEPFDIGLHMTMDSDWHNYWVNPGDAGEPTYVIWDLPDGFEVDEIRWPFPQKIDVGPLSSYGYSDEVLLPMRVRPPDDIASDTVALSGTAMWLICADICLTAEQEVSLTLAVGDPAPDPAWAAAFRESETLHPPDLADWSFSATSSSGGYTLHASAPDGWRGAFEGSFFFVDTPATLAHAEAQRTKQASGGFALTLVESPYANEPAETLTGVLVAPDGATWDGVHGAMSVNAPVQPGPVADAVSSGAQPTLILAMLFAFVGGLILNLMPCVFPILSIKILGFARGRAHAPQTIRNHGLVFGLGVVVSFWVLAGILLALRTGGQQLGWGFQLQSPLMVGGLAVLMFALGLMLLGVFEIGYGLARIGSASDSKEGAGGAFLSGVLAVMVATPCTAPFMGAALGYAVTQTVASSVVVFTSLGVGMALPYVLLSLFPGWIQRLPKPGRWMETLKQALAFPMFATAVWLVWVFGTLTGNTGVAYLLLALTIVGLGAWIYGRWGMPSATRRSRLTSTGFATAAVVAAFLVIGAGADETSAADTSDPEWLAFDQAEVDRLAASGEPVFVDFTAAWCLSCQANKIAVLNTDRVGDAFRERGVVRFRADWTRRDEEIARALARFGRSGVPLYVLYPGTSEPVLLPEILTPGIVLDALDRLPAPVAESGETRETNS